MACSEWSLLRSLWKKVRQLEKSTPAVLVALVTNYSYVFSCWLPTCPCGSGGIFEFDLSDFWDSSDIWWEGCLDKKIKRQKDKKIERQKGKKQWDINTKRQRPNMIVYCYDVLAVLYSFLGGKNMIQLQHSCTLFNSRCVVYQYTLIDRMILLGSETSWLVYLGSTAKHFWSQEDFSANIH